MGYLNDSTEGIKTSGRKMYRGILTGKSVYVNANSKRYDALEFT